MEEFEIIEYVQRAQAGDREAFGILVQEFESTVFAIVMKRLRNASEAREVTQEVFLRAMRKIDQLREPERFAGWLTRIAVRLSINRAVRRPQESTHDSDLLHQLIPGESIIPLDEVLQQERAAQVRDGLNRLREMDRETLLAFYFQGQSLQEMSDQFQSPVGTIKRRLHTARHRLRDELLELQSA